MTKTTLKALRGSIRKWRGIIAGKLVDNGCDNCPLCITFENTCADCPIAITVGETNCTATPYALWRDHKSIDHKSWPPWTVTKGCTTCKQLAKAELTFLKSLLPAKHKSVKRKGIHERKKGS